MTTELQSLLDAVDWDAALAAPRYAGGHNDVLLALFRGAEILADVSSGDYQGTVGVAYRLPDGRVVIVSDYYGSCSGCDAWEDAGDDAARKMIHDLATNAHAFASVSDAVAWLRTASTDATTYDVHEVGPLLIEKLASPA